MNATCSPPCIACQAGLAIACAHTEHRIRAHERAHIAKAIAAAIDRGQLLALTRTLKENPDMRRTAGLLVHTLVTVLDELDQNEAAA